MIVPIEHLLVISTILFVLGLACVIVRRSLIMILIGAEIMLNAVGLDPGRCRSLLAADRCSDHGDFPDGHDFGGGLHFPGHGGLPAAAQEQYRCPCV